MAPTKVAAVITARPSLSRCLTALRAMEAHRDIELTVITAASAVLEKYGNVHQAIADEGFTVAASTHMIIEGDTPANMARSVGLGLLDLPRIIEQLQPEYVISIADRFETVATSITAAYMNTPLVHLQGGEVSGNIDDRVRNANTALADVHLVATRAAANRVIEIGADPARVYITGCPSIDLVQEMLVTRPSGALSFDPYERYGGVGQSPDLSDGYIVVLQHPVTDEFEASRIQTHETLKAVAEAAVPVLWFWPNVDAGTEGTSKAIRSYRENYNSSLFHFFKNMDPVDFLELLANSRCLVGNSSVGIRESGCLGLPVVNIGSRQTRRERSGNVQDAEPKATSIRAALESQLAAGSYPHDELYGDGTAGERCAAAILSDRAKMS